MSCSKARSFRAWPLWLLSLLAAAAPAAAAKNKPSSHPGMVEVDGRLFPDLAPLPPMPYPSYNPRTPEKEDLGKRLFFDPRLSGDGRLSCASCHHPELDFGDNGKTAVARDGKVLFRRTRSLKNVGYNKTYFWDGRAKSLEDQFFMVLENPDEMGNNREALASRLKAVPEYRERFEKAFGKEGITARTISCAVATYERSLRVGPTIFDAHLRGDDSDMAGPVAAGLKLFKGKARCVVCHNGPTLSDGKFHNTGLTPGAPEDAGRERVDGRAESRRKFRTPMLRNSSHNTPYFHDGSIGPIEVLLDFYNRGGNMKEGVDPDIKPLHLTREEILELKAFLYSMGERDYDKSRDKYEHKMSAQEEALYHPQRN